MIKEADGDDFESARSLEQGLTFTAAGRMFAKRGMEFSASKYLNLGIRDPRTQEYTNLGLLLSDQCPHTIKVGVFDDDNSTVIRDRQEFTGSVFRQLEETFAYLKLCNRTAGPVKGLRRVDRQDYPEGAVREALLNAIIHRDYAYSASTIISVNRTEMRFSSRGGLLGSLTPQDIIDGWSELRNPMLANVFFRLDFIEAYGIGIRKIYNLYANCARQPEITPTPNVFRLTLPNRNETGATQTAMQSKTAANVARIMDYIEEHGEARGEQISELLGLKRTRVYILLRQMRAQRLIEPVRHGVYAKRKGQ